MSVLINIEMPTSCFDCPFMLHRNFCLVNTKIEFSDEEYSELKGRYIGCPLVSVPKHGRLIDLDAPLRFEVMANAKMNQSVVNIYAPVVIEAEEEI